MKVKKLKEVKGNEMQLAFLEGVIMPNGEFISNGRCIFLKDNDKLVVPEEEPKK